MNLIVYLIIVLYFLFANLTTVIISKNTFGKCLPLTMMGCAFSLFFSQMIFKTFSVGFFIGIVYALLSVFLIVYKYIKKEKIDIIKNNYCTAGFIAFIVVVTMVTIFDYNRMFSHWDEYSHWGEMLKEMIRIDKFYSVSESVLQAHKDYPPLLQLFELFIIKLCGSYKETYAIFALHFIELGLFIPFIPEKNNNKKLTIFVGVFCNALLIFLTTLLFDQHGIINSIYNDYFMAVLVAYGLGIVIFSENLTSKFTIINICLTSSFLLLTKQIGLTLYLMILFFYFVSIILKNKNIFNKENILKKIAVIVFVIIIPLLFWTYWSNFVKNIDVPSQFNLSDIKLSELYGISTGNMGRSDQVQASTNFMRDIKSRNLTTSYIQLSYFQAIVLMLLIVYIICKKNGKNFDRNKLVLLLSTLIIGALGYAFVMYCTYVFCFKDGEAIGLASFDRYMSTYVLVCSYVVIMILVYLSLKNKKVKPIIFATITLFVLSSPSALVNMYPEFGYHQTNMYETNAQIIRAKLSGNEKIFIIAEDSVRDFQYFIKYYANPIMTNMEDYNWPTEEGFDYKDYYDRLKTDIINYDYLYIAKTNERFVDNYAFVFDHQKVKEGQLYRINVNDNEISYELIN